eukprot:1033135_1
MRIIRSLPYYQPLKLKIEDHHNYKQIKNVQRDQNKLVQFYKETYQGVLNDFIHLVSHHHNDLDEIYDIVSNDKSLNCNALECELSLRYNRDRETETDFNMNHIPAVKMSQNGHNDLNENVSFDSNSDSDNWATYDIDDDAYVDDPRDLGQTEAELEFIFIRNLFDAIHCYILHAYDFGFRVHQNDQQKSTEYRNYIFETIAKIIEEKKSIMPQTNGRTTTNKYNLNIADTKTSAHGKNNTNLFLDDLFKEMLSKMALIELKGIYDFFHEEGYDTDAIERDVKNQRQCNVFLRISPKAYGAVAQYVAMKTSWKSSLATGFTFYYWGYYKKQAAEQSMKMEQVMGDLIIKHRDHDSGYRPHELYVDAKYGNLKEEMQKNTIHNLDPNIFNLSLIKANSLLNTKKARQLTANPLRLTGYYTTTRHYGITRDTPVKASNLISVIFYTDFSKLSTAFSSTFRKQKFTETLHETKRRNAEFAIWSRLLRETVDLFGTQISEISTSNSFYCGMSVRMAMPQFSMRLCGPTSTSRQMAVAIRFGGSHGIIMQLSINGGEDQCQDLRGFDCGWISDFSVEDECLFMGGHAPIKIDNVIVRTIHGTVIDDYDVFFEALYYFDCMISGSNLFYAYRDTGYKSLITDESLMILDNLIKHKLETNDFQNNYPQYINDTFESFVNSKTRIVLYMRSLLLWCSSGSRLLLHNPTMEVLDTDEIHESQNLLKNTIIKLFKNAKHIMIYTTSKFGVHEYPFDIMSLLLVLTELDLALCLPEGFLVTIDAQCYRKITYSSWLARLSSTDKREMQNAWNVSFSLQTEEHSVVIKMNESQTTNKSKLKPSMKSLLSYFINELMSHTFIEAAVVEIVEYAFGADLGVFMTGSMSMQNRLRFKHLMERNFGGSVDVLVNEYNEEEGSYYFNDMRNIQIEIQSPKKTLIAAHIESKMSEYFGNVFGENLHLKFIVRDHELREYKIVCAYSQSVMYYEHNGFISAYGAINKDETEITINYVFYSKQKNPFSVKRK